MSERQNNDVMQPPTSPGSTKSAAFHVGEPEHSEKKWAT